jgi:hypothetical protein
MKETINIFDPSAGWAGRLIGAMASDGNRNIHYIGTDPNTDHNLPDGTTKYHNVASFFNDYARNSGKLYKKSHTFEIFQSGSEMISQDSNFQKYKGKLDLVFTSPPYWCKEVYSDDPEQSCHKFKHYDNWVNGFLRPTLETCVEYLKSDRYLLWNIADAQFDDKMLPLEEDSRKILLELGMKYVTTLKMTLGQMPGGNRFEETGEKESVKTNTVFGEVTEEVPVVRGMMKNFCQVKNNGKKIFLKYEPIFVYHKQ